MRQRACMLPLMFCASLPPSSALPAHVSAVTLATLPQCHTAAVDLFAELEGDPSTQRGRRGKASSSGRASSGGGSSGRRGGGAPGGGTSSKLARMAGVGGASMGAMAAFYGWVALGTLGAPRCACCGDRVARCPPFRPPGLTGRGLRLCVPPLFLPARCSAASWAWLAMWRAPPTAT